MITFRSDEMALSMPLTPGGRKLLSLRMVLWNGSSGPCV
jgi:hypothetical protein